MTQPNQNIEAIYSLSPMQQGMLFHTLYAPPEAGMYLQQLVCTLEGELEVGHFQAAWQQVVERHAALRTFFVWEDRAEPLQIVCRQVHLPWDLQDWRQTPVAIQEARFADFLQEDRRRGFVCSQAPLLRFTLLHLADRRYRFIWTFHHLLLDGWCLSLILEDVLAGYQGLCRGQRLERPRSRSYRDYIGWLKNQDLAGAKAFWQAELKGFTTPTPLPGSPADASQSRHYQEQEITLSEAAGMALQALARGRRLTLSTLVQAAWALLLARYSGERDVVFGATVSGRPPDLAGVETIVGVFINTLPVRVRLAPGTPLAAVLRELMLRQVEREPYAHTPLVDIQAASAVPGGTPLFESLVVVENYPIRNREQTFAGLRLADIRGYERTNYPLTLLMMPGPPLVLRIAYDSDRFAQDTITRMLGHLERLLDAMPGHEEQAIDRLPLLTQAERRQLAQWNATAVAYPQDTCLHELIEAQVERSPEALAVVFEERRLTYRELNARANRLAHHLMTLGVGPETLVGVCMERSLELVIALLGVLKAGAAYLPLDPGYPQERLAFMLTDAQVSVVLCQRHLLARLPGAERLQIVGLDDEPGDGEALRNQPAANSHTRVRPHNLAYVIYTSGSTGQPKGAMNTHRGIVNRLLWMQDAYRLDTDDRVLQKTPFSFDVSVWEFFWPLLAGVRLVIARPEGHKDSGYLVELIRREAITTLHFVPPMLQVFLQEPEVSACRSLRRVICSGEALPFELQTRFFARLDAELHNLYGPTEAAIDVTAWACRRDGELALVPIGRPIANTRIYLLDDHLQPVPVGVTGELYIGGVNLARGYYRRPALTAERFIPNPFSADPGERLYRTGDLARYAPDGHIEYLGRTDHQVKVRGYRIELGEIEAALAAHPAVREAVVIARGQGQDRQLLAYLVPEGEAPAINELKRFLGQCLPDYMVPEIFISLEALPLTANGKVDRRALPAPSGERPRLETAFALPGSELERRIADLWRQILKLDRVGIHDNFFDLGGNSLRLMPLHKRLQETLGLASLTLVDLFKYPTIHALVQHLSQAEQPAAAPARQERGEVRSGRQALLDQQRQLRQQQRRS